MLSRLGAGLALSAALLLAGCEFSKGHSAGSGDSSLPAAPVGFLGGLMLSGEDELDDIVTALPRFDGAAGSAITQSSDTDASGNTRTAVGLTSPSGSLNHQFNYWGDGSGTPDDRLAGSTAPVTVSGRAYNQYILGGGASGEPLDTDGGGDDGRAYVRAFTDRGIGGADGTNYLAAAVWLFVPDDPSADDYILGAAANGTDSFNGANVAGLTGSATYAGAAIGLALVNGSPREFQGAVALTASFLGLGSVSGGMGDFTGADGNNFAGRVALAAAALTAGSNSFSGALSGSGGIFSGASGNWGGRFFNDDSRGSGYHPLGIAGTAAGGRVVGGAPNFFAIGFQSTLATSTGANALSRFLSTLSVSGEAGFTLHLTSQPVVIGDYISQFPSFNPTVTIALEVEAGLPSNNPAYHLVYDPDGAATVAARTTLVSSGSNSTPSSFSLGGKTYHLLRLGADAGEPFDIDADGSDDGRVYLHAINNRPRKGGTNYLAGGAWLYVPDDASADDYVLGAGARGVNPVGANQVLGLTGTATYSGAAVGIYSDSGSVDEFQAQVNLNADFGTNTEAGSVSGTMSNFTGSDGALPGSVTLGSASLTAASNAFSGTISGSGSTFSGVSGNWGGALYVSESRIVTDQPRGIAGTVGGGVAADNFYFAGAYIAEKD